MERYFNSEQISLTGRTFTQAEKMAGRYFGIGPAEWMERRYDVRTLAFLEKHEVREGTFAQLCRYQVSRERKEKDEGLHFYRICLQDDRILDAVERAHSFIRLSPLLLYIAAHELVHVIRFDRGESNFDAPEEEKTDEEAKVHRITRNMLKPATDTDLNLVLDCFSSDYRIGDLVRQS